LGRIVVTWKAHIFPLSVVLPALVIGIIGGAYLLEVRWTPVNTLVIFLIIVTGIILECIASVKIANLRFSEPSTTGSREDRGDIDIGTMPKR
jgi:hypothetical protein